MQIDAEALCGSYDAIFHTDIEAVEAFVMKAEVVGSQFRIIPLRLGLLVRHGWFGRWSVVGGKWTGWEEMMAKPSQLRRKMTELSAGSAGRVVCQTSPQLHF